MNQSFLLLSIRALVCCALLSAARVASPAVVAQTPPAAAAPRFQIAYRLSMSQPLSHLFEVRIEVETAGGADHVDFQMPRWSPGRYGVFEFAKNVQEVSATGICPPDAKCKLAPLPVKRLDTQTWRVAASGSNGVALSYKVFGDDLSGTFSQLDARHANYNGHSVFMYVAGHKPDPVSLWIDPPAGWRIVNGYTDRPDQREWRYPNYDVMADAPTEIAPDWTLDEFKLDGKSYRIVVHSFGDEGGKRPSFARDVEKIVRAETAMMGTPDFESYTFLIHFDPTARRGDGMEHLTSTQLITPRTLAANGSYKGMLETAAHEFFHVWNVKRLRPVGLGPWDFTAPVVTRSLWLAEGFTNYYGNVMMLRAGLESEKDFLEVFGDTINGVENSPGSRLMSAEESSVLAPFLDRATHDQRTNLQNTAVGYYPKGEVLGLVLDLWIRGKTRGRASLDDVMRRMYDEFYLRSPQESYYLRGRGYTNEDFVRVVSEVAGTSAEDFFRRYIGGTETPPYEEVFAYVGLRLARRQHEREPYTAGIAIDFRDQQNVSVANVRNGSPAERAGLKQGDVLLNIGTGSVTRNDWRAALNKFKQGDRVPVTLRRGSQTVQATITLDEPDNYVYSIEEDKNASQEALAMRAAWYAGRKR